MEVHERIRKIRESKKLLSKDVAEQLGVSASAYTLLEKGQRRLRVEHAQKIAKVLEVSVGELVGEEPTPAAADPHEYRHLRRIGTPELRKRLKPIVGDRTEEVIHCLQSLIVESKV